MENSIRATFKLSNGINMPVLGIGMWQVETEKDVRTSCEQAFKNGYWHIDNAAIYGNEHWVGDAIKDFTKREDIFITSKLWNTEHLNAEAAFQKTLDDLQTDHLDLYLIHWPAVIYNNYVAAWKSLVNIYESGRVKAIGVSNFNREHIDKIIEATGVTPHVNQVERHPLFQQKELNKFCTDLGITMTAYSPLGSGRLGLMVPKIEPVAAKHGKTVAQVVLRWQLQTNWIIIPKSITPARVIENKDIFDFNLDDDDIKIINAMDAAERFAPDPLKADF